MALVIRRVAASMPARIRVPGEGSGAGIRIENREWKEQGGS